MLILLVVELLVMVTLLARVYRSYSHFSKEYQSYLNPYWLAPLSLWLIDYFRITDRIPESISNVHHLMFGLHGSKVAVVRTKCFIVQILSFCLLIIVGSTLLGWVTETGAEMLAYGGGLMLFLPFLMYKNLASQLQKKKRQMLLDLPEMVNQIVLLVNAGESVQKALMRCIERNPNVMKSPLLSELAVVAYEISINASFTKSMEDFNKRCGVQEVSLFTTTLLLNYKRGGDELVMSLKELSFTLWEKRKAIAKTLGEEASSKMVFPMVFIFLVVMVVVAAPAILMMEQ
ncbi:type II secretion system F family protein [Paenibacillus agricola]|uniref:Type II secretion system protein n=1 Tax=Paenibacillus agricola TaxID=2716264 RepID=A0ABX0J990_9BACL|nr:type II secretion system F family protein [Paenibacillus agricola]NHN30714.1 type II secretion system protein [Paenibacillus agricola]